MNPTSSLGSAAPTKPSQLTGASGVLGPGLRSGDVFVPGSRRYADTTSFLLTLEQWQPHRLVQRFQQRKVAGCWRCATGLPDSLRTAI
jgi:hypothetical protein